MVQCECTIFSIYYHQWMPERLKQVKILLFRVNIRSVEGLSSLMIAGPSLWKGGGDCDNPYEQPVKIQEGELYHAS